MPASAPARRNQRGEAVLKSHHRSGQANRVCLEEVGRLRGSNRPFAKREWRMPSSTESRNRTGLAVIVRPQLALAMGIEWPIVGLLVGDVAYSDVGLGEWTGFYDWLRRADGVLLGVRYWPAEPNESLFRDAASASYGTIGSRGSLDIYFSTDRNYDPQRSVDQEFLYDPVFRSAGGEWAIVFDTIALTPSDLERLRGSDALWVTVTPKK